MKQTNSGLSRLKEGLPSDGKRFGFLNRFTKGIGDLLQKVNIVLDQVGESKPYKIDYQQVEQQYLKLGLGDIDEFASSYTLGWAMLNDFINDKVIKQAVYEEVRVYLWKKKESGEIG